DAPTVTATDKEPAAATGEVSVLVFHGDPDEQDDPVQKAVTTIEALGAEHGFSVTPTSDPGAFTAKDLSQYRGVVFLTAECATLDAAQEGGLQDYTSDGGPFLGIRDAAKAQQQSDWFTGLVGARTAGTRPTAEEVAEVSASEENPPR